MKKLLAVILLALVLVAAVTGCGGAHRYDSRLTAADSLMQPNPDSALALIEALPPDSLTDEGDRAYRDLLLTQARYKAYRDILASDNIAVNHALDYFRARSGECEKLTRAYIYKGAVMDELGHPDSAMLYYKHAEATANEKDYNNLGQINTRIGALFRRYFADSQICYEKYSQALEYYKFAGNKRLQLICLLNMGSCSGITCNDTPEQLLNQASKLAIELNDSSNYYLCQELLCRQLSFDGSSIAKAKQIALHCLNEYPSYVNHDLLLDMADIYVKSGMLDSARYYLDMVTENARMANLGQVKTRKYLILSDISRIEGNTALSSHYDMLSHQVSDSISNNKVKYQIQQIENTFNRQQKTSFLSRISRLQWIIVVLSLIAVIVIAMLATAYIRRISNAKAIINELQNVNLAHTNNLLNQLDSKSIVIERLVTNLVSFMKSCARIETQCSTTEAAQRIKEAIVDVADDEFWEELASYIDKHHGGIFSTINKKAHLTKSEIRLIELACCGFSDLEMAIILGYSTSYVSNKRSQIANKLHIDVPLKTYLNILMKDGIASNPHRKQ